MAHYGGRGYPRRDWQGGRGSRKGGRGGPSLPRDEFEFRVVSNCYSTKLSCTDPNLVKDLRLYHYRIEIKPLKAVREKDITNEGVAPPIDKKEEKHPDAIVRFQNRLQKFGANETSRQVLMKLCDQFELSGLSFVTDGAELGYSNKLLFEEEEGTRGYGIQLSARQRYWVELQFVGAIPLMQMFSELPPDAEGFETAYKLVQAYNTILKHHMMRQCIVLDDPNTFYLTEEKQNDLLSKRGRNIFPEYYNHTRPSPFAPFIGLSHAAKLAKDGGIISTFNNKIEYIFREKQKNPHDGSTVDVPLLDTRDVRNATLAGIRIRNPFQKLSPAELSAVESELSKRVFTIKYQKGPKWAETKRRERGDGYVKRCGMFQKKGQRMFNENREEPRIKPSCEDETFEKDGKTVNVASYFKEVYDISIKYPNLPVVSTRRGFFPVEFLYQEVGRVQHSNDTKTVVEILKYYDEFSGSARMEHIKHIKLAASGAGGGNRRSLTELFRSFSISVSNEPLAFQARCLEAPSLCFGENQVERNTRSGSWNLARKRFLKCADLPSYAVVDLGQQNMMGAQHFMTSLFRVMNGHGMAIHNGGERLLHDLTVRGDVQNVMGWDHLRKLFGEAINLSKRAFLDGLGKRRLGFRTSVKDGGIWYDCLATRGIDTNTLEPFRNGPIFLIFKNQNRSTHVIENTKNGVRIKARLKYKMNNGAWVDAYQVQSVRHGEIIGVGYKADPEVPIHDIIEDDVAPNPRPLDELGNKPIECPSLVFFYIPEQRTDIYDCVKALSDLEFQVHSQVIVQEKCHSQRSIEQYCSNVALKCNTKLFSNENKACAWALPNQKNIHWLSDDRTMVFGYSLSYGRIHGRHVTAVAGSVCLSHPMQTAQTFEIHLVDHKADVIPAMVLQKIVKALAKLYFRHFQIVPKNFIVYRDGGSDGSFESIRKEEASAVRNTILELNKVVGQDIDPKITFIVAQKDHNIRIVEESKSSRSGNVPSGTLVDSCITSHESDGSFDFLLTPQGGLKGTSKPMLYRVILNENVAGRERLTRDDIYNMTYRMAFQYGTATKAPRKVPVLLNSERLANRVIKYGGYLGYTQLTVEESGLMICGDQESNSLKDFDTELRWSRPHITG